MRPHGCNGTLCETWGPNKRAFVLLPLKKEEEREREREKKGRSLERRMENVPSNKSNLFVCLVLRSERWPCSLPPSRGFCSIFETWNHSNSCSPLFRYRRFNYEIWRGGWINCVRYLRVVKLALRLTGL